MEKIQNQGWIVQVITVRGVVEMHALPLESGTEPQIARCTGDGADAEESCARLLAGACGVVLTQEPNRRPG